MSNLASYTRVQFFPPNMPRVTFYCHKCNEALNNVNGHPEAMQGIYNDRFLLLHNLTKGTVCESVDPEILKFLQNHAQHQIVFTAEDESTFLLDTDFSNPQELPEKNLGLRQTRDHGKKISILSREVVALEKLNIELNREIITLKREKAESLKREKAEFDHLVNSLNTANRDYVDLEKRYEKLRMDYQEVRNHFNYLNTTNRNYMDLEKCYDKLWMDYQEVRNELEGKSQ